MLQAFQRHPGRHGAVADDADDLVALLQLLTRLDHAVSRGYAGSRMACVERIVFAFLALTKSAQPSILPERMEPLTTPGEQFVHVGLIAGVPDNLVLRRVEQVMQGDRQFDHPKVGGEVPPDVGYHVDNLLPQFLAQSRKLCR